VIEQLQGSVAAREQLGMTKPGREPNQPKNDGGLNANLPVTDVSSDGAAQIG
jgi:hypothetical protein